MTVGLGLYMRITRNSVAIWCAATVAAVASLQANPTRFFTIGNLPGGNFVRPEGISADGSTIVGYAQGTPGQLGFRWTKSGGFEALSPLNGEFVSRAYDVSADGTVIVGVSYVSVSNPSTRGVRWTAGNGPELIKISTSVPLIEAYGVSANGSVVVGNTNQTGYWINENGSNALPPLSPNHASFAYAVSNDGSTVAGYSTDSVNHGRAIRWNQSQGLQNLGILPGFESSIATEISADGSTVVGYLDGPGDESRRAFRWTAAGGMQNLGLVSSFLQTQATSVSGDGRIVVGNANDQFGNQAFIWTPETGTLDLAAYLAPVLPANCRLVEAHVSDNGRVLTGWASIDGHSEGWVAEIPEPASGFMVLVGLSGCLLARGPKVTHTL